MARETQKEKIERVEKELNSANNIIQKLNDEISEMIDKADNSFENSCTYKQMQNEIKDLELKLKVSNDSINHNRKMFLEEVKKNDDLIKEIQKLNNENEVTKKVHNQRGAGRKPRFTDKQKKEIKEKRENGHTIKEIAKEFKCSVGLIHKLINEN